MSEPQKLPLLCPPPPTDFPALTAKSQPEDFIVEEVPLYEPCGSGTHTYAWIEKRNLNTMDAARRLAHAIGKSPRDAGYAGLKDAQAVTRQWISFEHVAEKEKLSAFVEPNLRVLKISQHANKLKMGHLRGNRFVIRLRFSRDEDCAKQGVVAARVRDIFATLRARGLPNYFGTQRFGRGGDNAELGRLLVRGDESAFEKLFAETNGSKRPADRKLRNLLVNAFQSELFNAVLAARMPDIGALAAGDLAFLHRNGAVFAIADDAAAAKEQPRADAFEISPSGPLFGPKMPAPTEKPGEIEAEILRKSGVTCEDFGRKEAERQPGARRSLRVALMEEPTFSVDDSGVLLTFALPSGSYATGVIQEITGTHQ